MIVIFKEEGVILNVFSDDQDMIGKEIVIVDHDEDSEDEYETFKMNVDDIDEAPEEVRDAALYRDELNPIEKEIDEDWKASEDKPHKTDPID